MSTRFTFTALAGLLSLQSGAEALSLPALRPSTVSTARAPFVRMDALTELEALKAQLAELEQAKLAMEQVTAMQPVAEVATTPVPEVVVAPIAPPVPVPAPIQAPELALPSTPMPELSIPSITPEKIAAALPSMPEVSNVMPIAKAVAAPAADAINPLLIDAGIVVSLPLLAVAITAYVGLLTGGADADKLAAVADAGPAEKRGSMRAQTMNAGMTPGSRSAPEIFFGGLENLGKEPFGWFFPSAPSPLHATGASLASASVPEPAGRQMGAKERARAEAAAPPPPQEDYAAAVAAEFRKKNLMAGADGQPMAGVVAPTVGVATPKPPAVAPPPKPVAVAAAPVAAVAPPQTAPPPPKTAPPPPEAAPPPPKVAPPPPKPVAVAPPVAAPVAAPVEAAPVEAAPVEAEAAEEGPASSMSAAERMTQLKELLEDGLLSQAEYDEKRLDILNSI